MYRSRLRMPFDAFPTVHPPGGSNADDGPPPALAGLTVEVPGAGDDGAAGESDGGGPAGEGAEEPDRAAAMALFVAGPTTPSGSSPCVAWNAVTAFQVCEWTGPKAPSTTRLGSWIIFRSVCS